MHYMTNVPHKMTFHEQRGVVKQVKHLKANKAQDPDKSPDKIPKWFLKLTADQISPFLTDIFQTTIDSGKKPTLHQWFKKGKDPILQITVQFR